MALHKCFLALLFIQQLAHADVELTQQVRANFGITTVIAATTQAVRHWQASAQVLDAAPLVATLADLRAAQAAASASRSELQRMEALYKADNAALKTVEAARAQAASDQARTQTLQAQLLSSWGAGLTCLPAAVREQLAQNVLHGKLVLMRAELVGNAPAPLAAHDAQLILAQGTRLNAKLLGAMPQSATQTVGNAYLISAVLNDKIELQPGQVVAVELQDAASAISGIKVPRAAIVRWQGKPWAYVEQAAGRYRRVAVSIKQGLSDGILLSDGIKPGDKVVSMGAGLLLGAEFAPTKAKEE